MSRRIRRPKHPLVTTLAIVVSGLVFAILSPPLDAAAPKARGRHTGLVPRVASTTSQEPVPAKSPETEETLPTIDVIKGLRTGQLSASAEGTGDGRMTLSLTNRTKTKLRVVLPPGLIASGTTGQFGGMGGMGGGMGMGGMGMGGMGGMGMGGMGGMGGGMGGMGGGMGGMGGMGGGMGGRGGMMGGTMPASMGMMMLGRLIMSLVGDRDSWDQKSLMSGMMMGMGGMGMGGMGMGGMGMGGMGMGGMGGGFRSVPPTSLPETMLQPRQVRHLPTAVVSLNGPGADARPLVPAKGESLRIGSMDQWTDDSRSLKAVTRLAEAKAPQTIAQMVLWYVTSGADWDDVGRLSKGWGNAQELALARRFVTRLEEPEPTGSRTEPGTLYWDLKTEGDRDRELPAAFRAAWDKLPVLGLSAQEGIPARPQGPAMACRMVVSGSVVDVKLAASHPSGAEWVELGEFRIKRSDRASEHALAAEAPKPTPEQVRQCDACLVGDAVAQAILDRLVRVRLSRGPRVNGKESFRIKIVNESPMILNGLALGAIEVREATTPSVLAGFCLPPLKSLTVPASADMVARLHLKEGVRVLAADLSGL